MEERWWSLLAGACLSSTKTATSLLTCTLENTAPSLMSATCCRWDPCCMAMRARIIMLSSLKSQSEKMWICSALDCSCSSLLDQSPWQRQGEVHGVSSGGRYCWAQGQSGEMKDGSWLLVFDIRRYKHWPPLQCSAHTVQLILTSASSSLISGLIYTLVVFPYSQGSYSSC